MRGMGRIFKRGPVYWIAYSYRGKEHRESSHSDNESQARKLLKKRIGETSTGTFLYFSGWRAGEMKALEWRDVDLDGKVVRLRPAVSKNKDRRVLPLAGELLGVVERARAECRPDCQFVFRDGGQPIGDFRKAWRTACGGRTEHDSRSRSALYSNAEHGPRRSLGSRCDGLIGTQNAQHLRPLQYSQRIRPCGGQRTPAGSSRRASN
jgi:integrase